MTVSELIDKLAELDPDLPVVQYSDKVDYAYPVDEIYVNHDGEVVVV